MYASAECAFMLLKRIRRGRCGRSRVVQFIQLLPKQGSCRFSLFFIFFILAYASLSLAECRWSTCIIHSSPALFQVVLTVVKLHLPSHHLWGFWVIDKWCLYCRPSATDTKNISGVRSL